MSEDYKFEGLLEAYLNTGGYPEQVLNPSVEYLSNLLDDILARDLIRLYPIKKAFVLKNLLKLIAASVGFRISYNISKGPPSHKMLRGNGQRNFVVKASTNLKSWLGSGF